MGGRLGSVAQIWRYPVKSMGGERLREATVTDRGIAGDRAWAVLDITSGKILSAKREARLLLASARTCPADGVLVDLPGRGEFQAGDAALARHLSDWLGRELRLMAAVPGQRATFEKGAIDGSDAVKEISTQPGMLFDTKSPLHVLTTAGLRAARKFHPDGDWDVRRFRPNVLVETEETGETAETEETEETADDTGPEQSWIGSTIRLDGTTAWVRKGTVRCVMTSHEQPGLPRDRDIHRTLVRHHANTLGVLAHPAPDSAQLLLGRPVRTT
ncbi:MOSC domain-containing protein [Streptomyces sp. TRM49041]|uniref:MOSC domain-containing protein n=1 Tax=Streptomyces sp. TRM49041 TaxID=2603216 RepID=UPI0011ECE767|nr:MOSC N-terminal beta barrel domain-containing protein [Streptomyces sp. TRM49041]